MRLPASGVSPTRSGARENHFSSASSLAKKVTRGKGTSTPSKALDVRGANAYYIRVHTQAL
jgi:hypothetical protein